MTCSCKAQTGCRNRVIVDENGVFQIASKVQLLFSSLPRVSSPSRSLFPHSHPNPHPSARHPSHPCCTRSSLATEQLYLLELCSELALHHHEACSSSSWYCGAHRVSVGARPCSRSFSRLSTLRSAIAAVYAAPPPTSHPLYETAADTELLYRQWGQSMPSPLLKEFLEQAEANQEKKGVDLSARMNLPGPLGDVARLGSSVFDNTRAISNGAIESSGTVRESDALGAPAAELAHSRLSPSTPHGSSNLGSAASKEKPVVPDTRLLPSKRKAVDAVSASQSPPGKRVLPPIVNVPTKEVVSQVSRYAREPQARVVDPRPRCADFSCPRRR